MTETDNSEEIKRERRRSWVRIIVTYIATVYIFIGSIALIAVSWTGEEAFSSAKEIFTMVLPIATGIVTYWFASRQPKQNSIGSELNNDKNIKTETAQGNTNS